MIAARRKEREYFQTSPDYGHLASRMGSEYLAELLSKVVTMFQDWILFDPAIFFKSFERNALSFLMSILPAATGECH